MKQDIKQKWVEALRSGDYKQGFGKLFVDSRGTYCCLGVLGCVAGLTINPNGLNFIPDGSEADDSLTGYHMLTTNVGISDEQIGVLWRMNDRDEKSFSEIADYIEGNI